ncbi:hypothetical protein [Ottowia sp.]|uniref:hypothetical protein n=1 Tax=Ottowia sp. TaxID=1898956 RepID=UPI0039647AA0
MLHAINGRPEQARAILTGALVGAMVGVQGIPELLHRGSTGRMNALNWRAASRRRLRKAERREGSHQPCPQAMTCACCTRSKLPKARWSSRWKKPPASSTAPGSLATWCCRHRRG